MNGTDITYVVPVVPLLANGGLALRFRPAARAFMPAEQQARETHRAVILALGGLSFAGFVGVVTLSNPGTPYVLPAASLLAESFALYFAALNLQSYKSRRSLDLVSDGLFQGAGLGLALALGALSLKVAGGGWQGYAIALLLIGVAVADATARLRLTWKDLKARDRPDG